MMSQTLRYISSLHARTSLRAFASQAELKKTALYDLHKELGGKMVPFAGYSMPIQYKEGIVKSHLHTRQADCASLFDVSHMGQLRIDGADRIKFLESAVVGDLEALTPGQSKLSLLTTDEGGILDDCVITSYDDHLYMVINAGNVDVDYQQLHKLMADFKGDAKITPLTDRSLIAVQGPGAVAILADNVSDPDFLKTMPFMTGQPMDVYGVNCIVTRCGYTGEDGVEISVASSQVQELTRRILEHEQIWMAGLGARDSLRLEAGLCLHGHDLSTNTTPVEAALMWTIGKRRREDRNFPGAEIILQEFQDKANTRKRVGFVLPKGCPPAREGAAIFADEKKVGVVTSGTISPILNHAIGMAYLDRGYFALKTTGLQVQIRKKYYELKLAKMPFVPTNYYT